MKIFEHLSDVVCVTMGLWAVICEACGVVHLRMASGFCDSVVTVVQAPLSTLERIGGLKTGRR
jgi:hypothetical protein